jgi:glucokinase
MLDQRTERAGSVVRTSGARPIEPTADPIEPPPGPATIALGLDVGGTKLAAGVVQGDGSVLSRAVVPSRVDDGPQLMLERLFALGREVVDLAGLPLDGVDGVGIACGGPLDPWEGVILSPPNLPGWDRIPIIALAEQALGIPAAVENDATAGALAEWWFGAGRSRDATDLVYLTVSTGVGGGLILDRRLYRGATGNAGELGHLTVDYLGRECRCGRRGCLEAYASGTNIAARASEAIAAGERSSLDGARPVTAEAVAQAAEQGDELAGRIWDESLAILGSAVANIIDVFDPTVVVLGGGVTRAGEDRFLRPVREAALRQAYGPAATNAEVVLAELGAQHDIVSAAVVAFDRLTARDGSPA